MARETYNYWRAQQVLEYELTVCDSLLLYRARIVPAKFQHNTLCKIHRSHQGIERCHLHVSNNFSVVASQIEQLIKNYPTCVKVTPPTREPISPAQVSLAESG